MTRARSRMPAAPLMHPVAAFAARERIRQCVTVLDLAGRSGVSRGIISAWRRRPTPSIATVESVLGALGYRLAVVPLDSPIPPFPEGTER